VDLRKGVKSCSRFGGKYWRLDVKKKIRRISELKTSKLALRFRMQGLFAHTIHGLMFLQRSQICHCTLTGSTF
jgi:hypothetical protein